MWIAILVRRCLLLQWLHNKRHVVSNHQHPDCLFNRLLRRTSKKTSSLHVTGLCEGNPPVVVGFPSQRASNAESASIDDVIMFILNLVIVIFSMVWGRVGGMGYVCACVCVCVCVCVGGGGGGGGGAFQKDLWALQCKISYILMSE